jgi:GNAT superfamily N-acetyltransferase
MSDNMRITVEDDPPADERRVVLEGLLAFNVAYIGDPHFETVAVFLRDTGGRVRGGLLGRIQWRWLYVEKFWLPEELRGRGHGSELLRSAEAHALARGCLGTYLDTFEYQALPFYEKHGYEVFGILDGYPPGYRQFYLRKALSTPADGEAGATRAS